MDNKALFKISYGLYVVTTAENGFDNGCIINTAMQVTSTPLRISVTINKANKTHDMIAAVKKFNLSVIAEGADFELFKHFGFSSGNNTNKFADYDKAVRADNGIYYITEGTNAYISAEVKEQVDLGTHTMFIAEVTDAKILSDKETVTYSYYQSNIKPKPQPKEESVKGYRCKICGYIYEGDELPEDFVCPLCKHGAADFEKIS